MIEDDLRAAMQAHDHEAPIAADVRPVVHRSRRTPAVAGAVLAVAAVVVAVTLIWSRPWTHHSTPAGTGSLTCPPRYEAPEAGAPWVPANPTGDIDGSARLAPNETPASVIVCFFGHGAKFGLTVNSKLTGTRTLGGDLHSVAETLTWAPKTTGAGCEQYATTTDGDYYLIALTYQSGTEWVAAPGNHCTGSSNGQFVSGANLRAYADDAYTRGHWSTTVSKRNSGRFYSPGRLGQETRMVPGEPTSLTIKWPADSSSPFHIRSGHPGTDYSQLVDALNAADASRSQSECSGGPGARYELTFGYAEGPSVAVGVSPGCHPDVDNGSLQADNANELVPIIQRLLNQH